MVTIKTRFDGEKIEVPEELRKAGPGEVVLVFQPPQTGLGSAPRRPSIWDVIGKRNSVATIDDVNRRVREERDSWGDR
jgi:hypothetical protein